VFFFFDQEVEAHNLTAVSSSYNIDITKPLHYPPLSEADSRGTLGDSKKSTYLSPSPSTRSRSGGVLTGKQTRWVMGGYRDLV